MISKRDLLLNKCGELAIWDVHGIPYGNDRSAIFDIFQDPEPHPDYKYRFDDLEDLDTIKVTWIKK